MTVDVLDTNGLRKCLQQFMAEEDYASWLRLLARAWTADPRLQKGHVKSCIEIAWRAVQNVVDNEPDGGYREALGGSDGNRLEYAVELQKNVEHWLDEWALQVEPAIVKTGVCSFDHTFSSKLVHQ